MSYDDTERAQALVREDTLRRRLQDLAARRPPEFRDGAGQLHPDIAEWATGLAAGVNVPHLVIVGGLGAGKTWSTWEALEAAVRDGYTGGDLMVNAADFREWVTPPVDFAQLRACERAGVLILDDLGAIEVSTWNKGFLYQIINRRYEWHRPVVITSTQRDIGGMVGDAASSRLARNVKVVLLDGPDRRRQEKGE